MVETITVGIIRRILDGLPDDQPVLVVNEQDGMAYPVQSLDPETVKDQGGTQFLLLEFCTDPDEFFGFDPDDDTVIRTDD